MLFWITAGLLTLIVGAVLAAALWRAPQAAASGQDIDVYRDQLKEVERDLERGVLTAAEAEAVRVEVSRRILAADQDKTGPTQAGQRPSAPVLALLALALAGGVALYWKIGAPGYGDLPLGERVAALEEAAKNRPSQSQAEAQAQVPSGGSEADPAYLDLVVQLRQVLATRPDSLEGFVRLARAESLLGNFRAARLAQARVIALKGDAADAEDYGRYAEMMILAAGGYVSPEAEEALNQVLRREPKNATARYYYGLLFDQSGRPDRAFRLWRTLLEESTGDEPWIEPIRLQIEEVAQRAGITFRLPPAFDGDTQEMIRGMVSGLADRLANQGGTPDEWARLVRAYGVLGETDNARAVWENAQEVFGDNAEALAPIRAEAEAAGLLE